MCTLNCRFSVVSREGIFSKKVPLRSVAQVFIVFFAGFCLILLLLNTASGVNVVVDVFSCFVCCAPQREVL